MKFDVVKKGYNQAQVEEYIQKLTNDNNQVITRQKAAIEQLKQENDALTEKVNSYEKKKDEIFVAFVEAQETSAKLKRKAEQRFAEEMERLKLFQQKWTNYAKNVIKTLTAEEAEKFDQMSNKFNEVLSVYAKDVEIVLPQVKKQPQQQADKSFDPIKKVTKFLDNFDEQEDTKPITKQVEQPKEDVVEEKLVDTAKNTLVDATEQTVQQPKAAIELEDAVVEDEEIVMTKAPLEVEALAEELVPQEEIIENPVPKPEKKDEIKEQVAKLFAEDGHPDDGFEVQDISQNDIFNVQQSLEDLCKELGLIDENQR